ncbi:MAG: excinuclease ABC subunit UvrC [Planctomycetota bacterium]
MDAALRERLLEKVALFPEGPGVYSFLDERARVVYVGKAKSLRARVRSYLHVEDDGRIFYRHLRRTLRDVTCVATDTEKEALLLENALIKRHSPRWNIKLTDDKSFLQIELTTHGEWPMARLVRARGRRKKGEVFGPYSSARAVRETLRHLKRWFPLRTCSDAELRNRTRACIEHEMGRCLAPCVGLVSREGYAEVVDEVRLFLKGKDEHLLPRLEARMAEHSRALRFEQAARVRDQLQAIRRTLEQQRMNREGAGDQDVFGLAAETGLVCVLHLPVREGEVREPVPYELRTALDGPEALNAFLGQFYAPERYVPHEVLLPCPIEDQALLEEVLRERRGTQVEVKDQLRADRRRLVELASKNAALMLETGEGLRGVVSEMLGGLQRRLGLRRPPRSIECFDVSTIQGAFTVASKVRFEDGAPAPSGYRTFKVRTVEGQDDFAAMEEVIERRLRSGVERDDLPDLIVVDGGPPQLARALVAAARVGVDLERTELVGLAKARALGEDEEVSPRAFERIWRPAAEAPILLEPASLECRFLARVRDAAHRAAIGYHRELRRKAALRSGLEEVPGVGPKRRLALLRRFGSLRGIRDAGVDALSEVVPRALAESIVDYLARDRGLGPVPSTPPGPACESEPEV